MPLWTIIAGCCLFVPVGLAVLSYCYRNNKSEQFDRHAWRELKALKRLARKRNFQGGGRRGRRTVRN